MQAILYVIFEVLSWLLSILYGALMLRAILSWFISPYNRFYQILIRVTEPIIKPFRPLAMRISNGKLPIDIAPLFAFFAVLIVQRLLSFASYFIRFI